MAYARPPFRAHMLAEFPSVPIIFPTIARSLVPCAMFRDA